MKIIKKGNEVKIKKCSFCKTKFSYTYKDLTTFEYVQCPICGKGHKISRFDRNYKKVGE